MSDVNKDRLMDHEYDGIQEYDNKLPNWWLYTLYGAIVFAVGYWLVFHTFDVRLLPRERYEETMAAAAEAQLQRMAGQEINDDVLSLMATVPERVIEGQAIFDKFCVVCHASQGEGNVGPNLTDAYWLHGGRPTQILKVVTDGVPEKGMASWAGQLGPTRIQKVVSYVLTIQGTNIPGKKPEGEPFSLEDATDPVDGADPVEVDARTLEPLPDISPETSPENPAETSPEEAPAESDPVLEETEAIG